MFLFKKIFAPLFLPLSVIIELMIIGLILIWFTNKQKTGKVFITIGILILILLSNGVFSNQLLAPLEQRFPPLMIDSRHDIPVPNSPVKWIVLLGGGHQCNQKLPVTSQISGESLVRLVETIRIYRKIPGSKIILSGGAVFEACPEANTLFKVAQILNLPSRDIILDKDSRDTEEQAQRIRSIVGHDPFILVTSASHMPRSVALCNKLGLAPIPAPTNHLSMKNLSIQPADFYPSSGSLGKAERATYEYLGLLWAKIRNKV